MALSAPAPEEEPRPSLRLVPPQPPASDPERDEALAWFGRQVRWERRLDAVRASARPAGPTDEGKPS